MGFGKVMKKTGKFMHKTAHTVNHIRKSISQVIELIPPELLLSAMV